MAGSHFVTHVKWWFFIVPLLTIALMPLLPDKSYFEIPAAETASVEQILGATRASDAVDRTNAMFKRLFVETGMVAATMKTHSTSEISDGGVGALTGHWARNFWHLVYRMVYRASVMQLWLAGTFIVCLGALVDGTVRRRVRAAAAGVVSPLSFHIATHGILLLVGTIFVVLVLPIAVLAPYWIAVTACMAVLLWRAGAAFQI